MISCADAVRQLWDYLENDVDAIRRERIESHLTMCRRCCGEVEFAAALRQLLRSAALPHLPTDVEHRLLDFLESPELEAP